jgi:dolichyl-phosphate-mannose-protein mannosyltransferase
LTPDGARGPRAGWRARGWRWPVLVLLYLASRLAGLSALPMFLDERIHLRWAQWIAQGRRLRLPFISGRGLSVYLLAAVTPHASDPLLAGRLLTVVVGLVTLVALHRLATRASADARAGDVAALFYIACPFTLAYDRMVLTDAFLSAATALTLVLALSTAEEDAPRARTGVALGLAMAMGVLAKTTGILLLAVPAAALAIVATSARRAARAVALAYGVAAVAIAYPLWLFFRKTDELAGAMGVRDNESSFAGNATANLHLAAAWLWAYWTPPLAVLAAAGLVLAVVRRRHLRHAVLLALCATLPTLAFVAISEIWYPRYLLFTTVPLLALAARGAVEAVDGVRERTRLRPAVTAALCVVALALVLTPAILFDAALWTDPARAPWPALDRFQYVTGWPSGYGLRESMAFLRSERQRSARGLLLVTPGPSTTASAVRLLWAGDAGIEVRYVAPDPDPPPFSPEGAAGRDVIVVVSRAEAVRVPAAWAPRLALVFASFKPDGTPADEIYRACAAGSCP